MRNISARQSGGWVALFALLMNIQAAMADQGRLSLGTGVDFSTGKYGGTTATDVTYIPITGKYETQDWLFKLTVPYIQITGPANVTPNIGQTVYASSAVRTDAGLGDVVLATSYNLLNSVSSGLALDLTGKIKIATADKSKGLGSGADDYAAEMSVYKIFGAINAFATGGYKVYGQSAGYTLNNAFFGSLGLSYKYNDKTSMGLMYDYREPTTLLADPLKIWTVFANRKINSNWKAQAYLFSGSGNASPELGGGAVLTKIF